MSESDRALARRMARESLQRGDATGWFEKLYDAAQGDEQAIPWADMRTNPSLADWLESRSVAGNAKRALVIGCGLGDDAEELAHRGFAVTAFDISATAVAWCRRRFADTSVEYCVADMLDLRTEWYGAFDLVVEIYTLQSLPPELRTAAMRQMAGAVAPGGTLLLVARGREPDEDPGALPWPLAKEELEEFIGSGLAVANFADSLDRSEHPPVRHFRVEYHRNG